MRCIIVDDEPIAREGMETLISKEPALKLDGSFESAEAASAYMKSNEVDLIFLDINMPETNGIEFAYTVSAQSLIIFTTAYSGYGADSYEVDAIGYLVKPIDPVKFRKAIDKAITYHSLLINEKKKEEDRYEEDFIFVKSERKYLKVKLIDILFIEGLKDYVVIQTLEQSITTRMTLKAIADFLPAGIFFRINKSFLINKNHIDSFDSSDVLIKTYEIAIGKSYREEFLRICTTKKV